MRSRWARVRPRLFAPVDAASLAAFRVMFGVIMVWEVLRYFDHRWIARYYVNPDFHFTYYGFGWVRPWPGDGMYWHFALLGVLAALIAAGFCYRVCASLFFLAFSYVFVLDQTQYLNHLYLVCLISFLMIFIPAHRARSVDAALRPGLRSVTVPAWSLWLLRAQIGIVYSYAGLAKLNGDWLRGRPLSEWLAKRDDDPLLGALLAQEWSGYLFSYGGLAFDLLIVPLLLWRRTRAWAVAGAVAFHLLNARIFSIGIFPWFMIAATLLFLAPDWPKRLMPGPRGPDPRGPDKPAGRRGQTAVLTLAGIYLAVQLLVPLRHWLYPGVVHWTEEGHRFSWHMKLRDKAADVRLVATDSVSGRTWEIKQTPYLTKRQRRAMSRRPDMILQFAHEIADRLRGEGYDGVEIRAVAAASLNGRPHQLMIDPSTDLAAQPRTLGPAEWILPLEPPRPAAAAVTPPP